MSATLTNELISKLQDTVQCAVCLELFTEPRSLPCQHSFCTKCLQGILGTERTIRCPCCNKSTAVTNGVRQLPVDFRANIQLEILSEYQKARVPRGAVAAVAAAAAEEVVPPGGAGKEAVLSQPAAAVNVLDGRPVGDQPCPVCEKIPSYSESKYLNCGHRLCRGCVQFLLPVGGHTLHCPTCSRQTVILPATDTNPAVSSSHLPPRTRPRPRPVPSPKSNLSPSYGSSSTFSTAPVSSRGSQLVEDTHLTFHPNCGRLPVVVPTQITAHAAREPGLYDDAILLTSRHLKANERFEVRLHKQDERQFDSIQIGVTTHSPENYNSTPSLYSVNSGTWIMSGSTVWQVEQSVRRGVKEYSKSLSRLKEGDRVGVQRKHGYLHFYVNGIDLGRAVLCTPAIVYGVINLCDTKGKVTIMHDLDVTRPKPQTAVTPYRRFSYPANPASQPALTENTHSESRLTFHPNCGKGLVVHPNLIMVHRSTKDDQYGHTIVLTSRPLNPNEKFEVQLEKRTQKVDMRALSIAIGVTTHSPTDSNLPEHLSGLGPATLFMSGNEVWCYENQRLAAIKKYMYEESSKDLNSLQTGERVGVQRTEDGCLRFYIRKHEKDIDLCVVVRDVAAEVYGAVEVYGNAAEVTIIDCRVFINNRSTRT